ncbi:hypothetical protein [Lacipirellula limnantheis]|uniref:Uncharacterized protein n=1 Tax=Lacipirellula limnantheis TaxID=2528024 RepID=A0A517U6P1_9BACT|nr:hypothetical protein [Lacipirellula limnantheis]QDT76284.1 hypothetical protein I41_55340 [Lacipirellula limnantheis]
MNADQRGWMRVIIASMLFAMPTTTQCTTAEEVTYALASDIEQKFPESDATTDDEAILNSILPFTRYISERGLCAVRSRVHLDLNPTPWRPATLVEALIEEGFPKGESTNVVTHHDDSYLLAEKNFTFGGMKFSR